MDAYRSPRTGKLYFCRARHRFARRSRHEICHGLGRRSHQSPDARRLAPHRRISGCHDQQQIPGFDADLPVQTLLYQLDTAPAGFTISSTGVLTIDLPEGAAQGIQTITVRLTDASGFSVTRDYQVRVSSLNVGQAYGLVSQWTSTAVDTSQDTSPLVLPYEPILTEVIVNGLLPPVSTLATDTSNSVIPLIGNGINRLQAVEEPTTVETMKPVIEEGEAGTSNTSSPIDNEKPIEQPQPTNSSSSMPTPAAGGNQQSLWQRRFDWREQLRAAALVESALTDDIDLNWVNRTPQLATKLEHTAASSRPSPCGFSNRPASCC